MVKASKAAMVSGASAIGVGLVYVVAVAVAPEKYSQVTAGVAVTLATFIIGYVGMIAGK
jgi:hypothetical protein